MKAAIKVVLYEAYQMAGALGASAEAMDNILAAAEGRPLPHETFLPHPASHWMAEADTLRAELAAARERLKKAESMLELQKANNDRLLKEWAASIAEVDAALNRNTELNQRLATAEADAMELRSRCQRLSERNINMSCKAAFGDLDGVLAACGGYDEDTDRTFHEAVDEQTNFLQAEMDEWKERAEKAEADSRRLDWLESRGLTTHDPRDRHEIKPMGVHSWYCSDEQGEIVRWTARYIRSDYKTLRAAIDAAGGQG